jgi:hypothetical protein
MYIEKKPAKDAKSWHKTQGKKKIISTSKIINNIETK